MQKNQRSSAVSAAALSWQDLCRHAAQVKSAEVPDRAKQQIELHEKSKARAAGWPNTLEVLCSLCRISGSWFLILGPAVSTRCLQHDVALSAVQRCLDHYVLNIKDVIFGYHWHVTCMLQVVRA